VGFGNDEQQQYCRILHHSLETLSQATLGDSGVINLQENFLTLIQILGFVSLDYSQLYDSQQDIAVKVFYVEGGRSRNFFLRVEATQKETCVEIRVYPAPLLSAIRQQHLTSPQVVVWMSRLHDSAIEQILAGVIRLIICCTNG